MSTVDTFKEYASRLRLSKAQLEAVTECFKACFESEEDVGVEPAVTEIPDSTTPSEDRSRTASFRDDNMWGDVSMKDVLKTNNDRLAKMMKAKKVPRVKTGDEKTIMDYGRDVVNGNFHNIVSSEEDRQRNMRWQKFLNKTLGVNLVVDGKWGKKTDAAYRQYLAQKNKA